MTDLIARLSALTGPDREVDHAIAVWMCSPMDPPDIPRYTGSIDSALTLVPEGYHWHVHGLNDRAPVAGVCPDGRDCTDHYGGANPAIALCIAALRARAA